MKKMLLVLYAVWFTIGLVTVSQSACEPRQRRRNPAEWAALWVHFWAFCWFAPERRGAVCVCARAAERRVRPTVVREH
jgi:hypothetical protein